MFLSQNILPAEILNDPLKHTKAEPAELRGGKVVYSTNPVEFWAGESAKQAYPLLHRIALRVLACPASSSFSERIFSNSGRVTEKRRTRTATDLLDSYMIIKFGQRHLKLTNNEKRALARPVVSALTLAI